MIRLTMGRTRKGRALVRMKGRCEPSLKPQKIKKKLLNIIYINKGGLSPKNMDGLKTYLAEMQEKYDELMAKTESAKHMRHEVFLKAGSVEYARQFGMLRYLAEWTDFLVDLPDWIGNMIEIELEKTQARTIFHCEHCGESYDWFDSSGTYHCCEKNWELYG